MGSDSQQQFCLRWHNYQNSLLATLPQLLDGDDLTDVTLCAGGRTIKAHRIVLSACSQYFKDIFRELQPMQHPVIVLPGGDFNDLCALVTFMYSGEVNIYQHQLPGLLAMADTLHIRGLAEFTAESERKEVLETNRFKRAKVNESYRSGSGGTSPLMETVNPYRTMYPRKPKNGGGRARGEAGVASTGVTSWRNHQQLESEEAEDLSKRHNTQNVTTNHATTTTTTTTIATSNAGTPPSAATTPPEVTPLHQEVPTPPPAATSAPPPSNLSPSSLEQPQGETSSSRAQSKLYAMCFVCGKLLSNQYNLRVHMETHQNAHYACSSCNHVSRSRDALRKHVSYRHPPHQQQQQNQQPNQQLQDNKRHTT